MLDKIKSVQFVMIVSFLSSLILAFVAMSLKPAIDKILIYLLPNIFALGRTVVLKKK